MPQSPPALVNPAALRWARESIGYALDDAAPRIGVSIEKLSAAERGDDRLTLRQAETAADIYQRPLAALFLPEPPIEEPLEAQFRRLPGAPAPPWPRQMRALARRVRARQDAAAEIYELLDEPSPWRHLKIEYTDDPEVLGGRLRELLRIGLHEQRSWRDRSGYRALREWVDAVEGLGVLVMQDGSLPLIEMRGFASEHAVVPALVINTHDDPRARAFTTIHELGHLLRYEAGRSTGREGEVWCNDFAGEVLMPRYAFAESVDARHSSDPVEVISQLALEYGVTPRAAIVRAARLDLAPPAMVDEVIAVLDERAKEADEKSGDSGGGNYYLNTIAHLGPTFIQLVFSALDSQALTYPVASGLLGVKVNNFPTLREHAMHRAAIE